MEHALTQEQALILAVNRMGGQAPFARLLEVAQPTVWGWLNRSEKKELPAEHVLKVEAATRVSRHDLRPDIYPRGLQDDSPFVAAATLAAGPDLVAGSRHPFLQGPDAQSVRGTNEHRTAQSCRGHDEHESGGAA